MIAQQIGIDSVLPGDQKEYTSGFCHTIPEKLMTEILGKINIDEIIVKAIRLYVMVPWSSG